MNGRASSPCAARYNQMLTQCPNCQTTFRVTPEILQVAAGQVRCGRCQTQFDAVARLLDEAEGADVLSGRFLRPSVTPEQPADDSEPGAIEVDEPPAREEITLEGRRIEITGVYRALDADGQPQAERAERTETWAALDEVESSTEADHEISIDAVESDDRFQHPDDAAAVPDTPDPAIQHTSEPDDLDLLQPRRPTPTHLLWRIAAPLLALLLIAQIVHHERTLLARHPTLGEPLSRVYAALGVPLAPEWDLRAYEIRQWGVVSDGSQPGALRVRASVKNLAPFAQPYPLLKLVLEDRWGDEVRARAFKPQEYLDPTTPPERLLAPQQQANATIVIIDPGPDAEGFRFDACLPGRHGQVCAEDVAG